MLDTCSLENRTASSDDLCCLEAKLMLTLVLPSFVAIPQTLQTPDLSFDPSALSGMLDMAAREMRARPWDWHQLHGLVVKVGGLLNLG